MQGSTDTVVAVAAVPVVAAVAAVAAELDFHTLNWLALKPVELLLS